MKKIIPLLLLFPSLAFCQDLDVLLTNSIEVESDRYANVKGSPYFFEDFVKGNIISNGADTFKGMTLNYNAETSEFEIINEGKTVQLYKPMYMRVEVHPDDNPDLELEFPVIFQRGFSMKWLNRFGQMIYEGTDIKFIKDYSVSISVNTVQDVGKTINFKRFSNIEEYYFLIEGELTQIKLKEKKILKALKHSDLLEKFIDENNINIETESGLRKLLVYYETLET